MVCQYIKENLRRSFAVWERGEAVRVLLAALVALVFSLFPTIGLFAAFAGLTNETKWSIGIGLWFICLILIVTPYRMWKGKILYAKNLEDKIKSRIHIKCIEECTEPHGTSTPDVRTICLRVINASSSTILNNCLVKLVDWEDDLGNTSAFPEIALRTWYQVPPGSAGPFHMRPDDEKLIPVASLQETNEQSEIELGYAEPQNYRPYLSRDREYTLTIRALADVGAADVRKYKLHVNENGCLHMVEIK